MLNVDVGSNRIALRVRGAISVAALMLATLTGHAAQPAQDALLLAQAAKAPAGAATELEALVAAAKAEGQLTFYSAAPENVNRRISSAYTARYGVPAQSVRLNSVPLQQRYASEAEAGNFAADMVFIAGSAGPFTDEGIKRGWMESVSGAGLPVVRSGEFPSRFNRGATSVVQIAPWLIFYNTERVKGGDIPRDWPDLLDAKWKGQLLAADPRGSDASIEFWTMILDRYGESFFARMRGQNMRVIAGGGPVVVQALAAGEGSVAVPTIAAIVQGLKDRGGPVEVAMPAFTTGVEMQVALTARAKAKHPAAARLMANYVMSPEGNKVLNDDPGSFSIYDTRGLPADYQAPKPGAVARKDLIIKLFGL